MTNSPDTVIKLYEGSLRALDTKSQIFLAFVAITMTPVFTRLDQMGLPYWIRATEGVMVGVATLAFIFCLLPRRGRRSSYGLFDAKLTGESVAGLLKDCGYAFDPGETVATLHDIYRIKAAAVLLGTLLTAAYILSVAVAFGLA